MGLGTLSQLCSLLVEAPCCVFNPLSASVALIQKQLTGFYIRATLALNVLMQQASSISIVTDDIVFASTLISYQTHKHTQSTHRDQQTDIHIQSYINIPCHVLTAAICIKLTEKFADIKNLLYRGPKCLCFSKKSCIC